MSQDRVYDLRVEGCNEDEARRFLLSRRGDAEFHFPVVSWRTVREDVLAFLRTQEDATLMLYVADMDTDEEWLEVHTLENVETVNRLWLDDYYESDETDTYAVDPYAMD